MWWLLLAACGDEEVQDTQAPAVEAVYAVSVEGSLDFGDVEVGRSGEATVTLVNEGDVQALFLGTNAPAGVELQVLAPATPFVDPGQSLELTVVWTVTETGELWDDLELKLGPSPALVDSVLVPMVGNGLGPELKLSWTELDFGEVSVGCLDEYKLSLTNTGNTDLVIDSLFLSGGSSFSLRTPEEAFPWTLRSYDSVEVAVQFNPSTKQEEVAYLQVHSNVDEGLIEVRGTGSVDAEKTLEFVVGDRSRSTFLIHTNECVVPNSSWSQFSETFLAALPTFFQALQDTGRPYRVAALLQTTGVVNGSEPYIDESFTVEESVEAFEEMMNQTVGDNDQSFTTLLNGIDQNQSWLFEDEHWADSKLNLVTINRDLEQSGGGSGMTYVSRARTYKDDADDILFHAIAGGLSWTCGAEDPGGLNEAIRETGGYHGDICKEDWSDMMEALVAASVTSDEVFALEGTPLESSIQVRVDGFIEDLGWSYNPRLNSIDVDDLHLNTGQVLEVYYEQAGTCE